MPLSTLTGGGTWNPLRLPGLLGWFNVNPDFVTIDGTPNVLTWRSRHSAALTLTAGGGPGWLPNGWGTAIPAIDMSQASSDVLSTTTASIVAPGNATDAPFSLFCTFQPTVVADHTIACWQAAAGNSLSCLRMNNSGTGVLRYRRTDAAASNVDVDGTSELGFFRHRVGVLFTGTSVSIYLDGAIEVGPTASNVGALTCDTFKIGSGPGIDAFTGLVQDVVVMNQAVTPADYLAYYNWSRRTVG